MPFFAAAARQAQASADVKILNRLTDHLICKGCTLLPDCRSGIMRTLLVLHDNLPALHLLFCLVDLLRDILRERITDDPLEV